MSIRDEINHRCAEEPPRLVRLTGLLPGRPERREVYVVPEISRLVLDGPWGDGDEEERWVKVAEALAWFIEGRLVSVPERNAYHRDAFMLRLRQVRSWWWPPPEVWEIRVRAPDPGIRLFGRFAEWNTFVAVAWHDRGALGFPGTWEGRIAWRFAALQCLARWNGLFAPYPPLRREDYPDGYLSDAECI